MAAQDLASFEKRLTQHRLANGLTFLIYERSEAPVVSFYTYVNVGAAQEVPGITGLAHMFEHMAFKGTTKVGTTDYAAEKAALAKIDQAYQAYDRERRQTGRPVAKKLQALEKAWKDAQEEAEKYVGKNEFGEIIDREGGNGLNAMTSSDATVYFYSLPANKLELWAYLESERFRDPVFRQFYKERDVVMEERRLARRKPAYWPSDRGILLRGLYRAPLQATRDWIHERLARLLPRRRRTLPPDLLRAEQHCHRHRGRHSGPRRHPRARTVFRRLPAGPPPPVLRTEEPKQIVEREIRMPDNSQPIYVEGYHKPAVTDPDEAVYEAIADLLTNDRTARLYRRLVRDKKSRANRGHAGIPRHQVPEPHDFLRGAHAGTHQRGSAVGDARGDRPAPDGMGFRRRFEDGQNPRQGGSDPQSG